MLKVLPSLQARASHTHPLFDVYVRLTGSLACDQDIYEGPSRLKLHIQLAEAAVVTVAQFNLFFFCPILASPLLLLFLRTIPKNHPCKSLIQREFSVEFAQ